MNKELSKNKQAKWAKNKLT